MITEIEQYQKPRLRTWVEVNLRAAAENAKTIKAYTGSRLIAVLKADAYGHGAAPIAQALDAIADMFAVATVEEGIELRKVGIDKPILILINPLLTLAEKILAYDLTVAVDNWALVERLNEVASGTHPKEKYEPARPGSPKATVTRSVKVHLDVNTGMNRSGIHPKQVRTFFNKLKTLERIKIEGIFTHFATADEPHSVSKTSNSFTSVQLKRFTTLLASLQQAEPMLIHAANSAAALAIPESHFDAVRPGLSLYGIYPSTEKPILLQPALTWKTRVGWVDSIEAGEGVSYGQTYKAVSRMRLAALQVGYGDGYPRSCSNRGTALIAGKPRPIVGRICMDTTVVQLAPEDDVNIGDEAVLIGKQAHAEIRIDEVAAAAGTIPYEILTNISPRVKRIYC